MNLPGWFSTRCRCGQRFFCFNRAALQWLDGDDDLPLVGIEDDARREATRLGECFVDLSIEPFKLCLCGSMLNFLPDALLVSEVVM